MRVFQIEGGWGFDKLRLAERQKPMPGPGEVLIAMRAASLNARDLIVPERGYGRATGELPLIPLSDGVGEIADVGPGVTRFARGDRVCTSYFQRWISGAPTPEALASSLGGPLDGVMAEYACFSEAGVVPVPAYLTDAEAASLPCAALTAWNAVVTHGRTQPGDHILVQGTGSVALFALIFAKIAGAHVTVISSSDRKLEVARGLGADIAINYRTTPDWVRASRAVTESRGGFDNIIELGGAQTLPMSLRAIRPGGTLSMIGVLSGLQISASLGPIVARQVRLQGITVGSRFELEKMLGAMAQHQVRPLVDRMFAFDELIPALDHMRTGDRVGKTIIRFQQ